MSLTIAEQTRDYPRSQAALIDIIIVRLAGHSLLSDVLALLQSYDVKFKLSQAFIKPLYHMIA